jgi:hypothetical protein
MKYLILGFLLVTMSCFANCPDGAEPAWTSEVTSFGVGYTEVTALGQCWQDTKVSLNMEDALCLSLGYKSVAPGFAECLPTECKADGPAGLITCWNKIEFFCC